MQSNSTIPLGVLALEHNTTVDVLAKRLGDQVTVESGIRCVPTAVAQAMYDDRELRRVAREAQNAEQHAIQQARHQAQHAHVQAVRHRQERLREAGLYDDAMTAYEVMAGADEAARLEAKGRHLDEMMKAGRDGSMTMHVFDNHQEA